MSTVAVVFPGQGSQSAGMIKPWLDDPLAKLHLAEASEVLGYDIALLMTDDPCPKLNQTQFTQPAILTCSYLAWLILNKQSSIDCVVMAGHSLGEYTALLCAGALTFPQALQIVAKRGELMQACVPVGQGAMAALIGLSDDQVELMCATFQAKGQFVAPANYNAIGQVVVAGESRAVESLLIEAQAQGAKRAVLLPVSVPSHCALLSEAASLFRQYLDDFDFAELSIPVLSNVDAEPHQSGLDIKDKLGQQLIEPVQWVKTVQRMVADGVTHHLEMGPNKVLTGLCKRIDRQLQMANCTDPSQCEMVLEWINDQ